MTKNLKWIKGNPPTAGYYNVIGATPPSKPVKLSRKMYWTGSEWKARHVTANKSVVVMTHYGVESTVKTSKDRCPNPKCGKLTLKEYEYAVVCESCDFIECKE